MFEVRIILAIAALAVGAAEVLACEGQTGKVIFEDKFSDDAGGWSFGADYGLALKAPGAVFTLDATRDARTRLNETFNAKEGDFCAEMSMPANAGELHAAFGVVFLVTDSNNLWNATAHADGKVGLYKLVNNKYSTVWEVPGAATVKTGPADVNSIRAVVKGNTVTIIVNGKTIKAVRAQVPSGDFRFGFHAQYEKELGAPADFIVRSYKVTEAK